jgi:hypothetical protein
MLVLATSRRIQWLCYSLLLRPLKWAAIPRAILTISTALPGYIQPRKGILLGASVHTSKFSKRRNYAPDPTFQDVPHSAFVFLEWPKENARKTFAEEVLGNERMQDAEDQVGPKSHDDIGRGSIAG